MGTKVQYKSYCPTYHPMRGLNDDSGIGWSQYFDNKTLSGNLFNGFALGLVNGYSEYDKEMLKRTMLEHEAIFKKQVCELHRLYRIQKDLMDDFQKKDQFKYSILSDTSQSNSFSSRISSEVTKRAWQMPDLPVASTSYHMAPVASTDGMKSPLNFLKENNVQSIRFPIENGDPLRENSVQESKLKKIPGMTFDLHLPADVYFDSEDRDTKGKENVSDSSFRYTVHTDKMYGPECENDLKLTLGTGESSSLQEDRWRPDQHKQNGSQAHILTNLNEPTREICHELASDSNSTFPLGSRTHHGENQGHRLPTRLSTSFLGLQSALFKDRQEGIFSSCPYANKDEAMQEWLPYYNKAGGSQNNMSFFSSSLRNEKLPTSSELIQLKPTETHENLISNQTNAWFRMKPALGIEISERSPLIVSSSISGPTVCGTLCASSPLVSASTQPAIPPPCVNGSATIDAYISYNTAVQGSGNAYRNWQLNGDSGTHSRPGSDAPSYRNGFHHQSRLDFNSTFGDASFYGGQKCFTGLQRVDMNMNQKVLNEIGDRHIPEQNVKISGLEQSHGGMSWLTRKPACNVSVDLNNYASKTKFGANSESEWKQEKEKRLYNFPSSSQIGSDPYDSLNGKRLFGFPIPDQVLEHDTTDDTMSRDNHDLSYTKLSTNIEAPSLEGNIANGSLRSNSTRFSNQINLNSMSTEDEAEVPSQLPVKSLLSKVASQIDLEAPVASPPENSLSPNKSDCLRQKEAECCHEAFVREAAENIVEMSLDKWSNFDGVPLSQTTLKWFAEIITTNSEIGSVDDELDLFELMTLNLEEMKSDEYQCRPWNPEDHKEEKSSASLLLTRPRRGQARRRRQQRDFQKDILPGLASLSRYEVSEDLQTIGGLMRASGFSWPTGSTRRNPGGRRRAKSLAVSVEEIQVCPLPATKPEFEVDVGAVIGWGRTTRRCRRPRCPVSISVPLT